MSRIKLELPYSFSFTTQIPVRITDVNYGGHLGNDAVLSLIHEARLQYLQQLGYTELSFDGAALIMSDVAIEFKAEAFYGEVLEISVAAANISKVAFDLFYKITKTKDELKTLVAVAKTGMVCFDYTQRKITAVPSAAIQRLT